MTRKKIFLIPALFLCSILSFLTFSCSSGLNDESGEVSFTFTEPMLRKIISRDAGSGNGYNISDLMSGLSNLNFAPQNVKYQFIGTSSGIDEASQTANSFVLYLYDPGNYELYSINLIQSISAGLGNNPSQIISGMGGGFSEIFKSALVSKGDWGATDNYIDITERKYRSSDAASGELKDVSKTVSIRFLLDRNTLGFDTQAGYHITFYNTGNNSSGYPYGDFEDYDSKDYDHYSPKIRVELTSKGKTYIKESEIVQVEYAALGHAWNESPDMPEGQEKTYLLLAYSDDTYKIQEFDDGKLLSIVSEGSWKQNFTEDGIPALYIYEDGKSKEQIIPFAGDDGFKVMLNENPVWFSESDADEELADFRYLPVSVSFKNLPRGAKAKVYAEVFVNEPHGKKISLASGESSDFIIESNTVVNVRMKLIDIGYKPGEPDNPSEENVKDIPASGTIEKDNRALLINLNYNASSLYLNQGQFIFTAKYADGSALSEKDTEDLLWDIEMLHKGKNINQIDDNAGPYYKVSGNQLSLYKHIPLPSEGEYQIYVTAQLPISESDLNTITSSQTFNVYVPDRHIYDISDEYNDIRYAQSLHNVVITGDVADDDWNWELTDESSDHILQNIFANHRNTLESLTFNGSFVSPDYTDASESPLYNESSGIKFGRRVALIFNGTAKIGDFLFYGASNIETIKFTTDESTVGEESFRDISSISNIDLTGVTTIGEYAFNGSNLKSITIPESVTLIDGGAFNSCFELSEAIFAVTEGWMYVMNGDSYPANVSGSYALSTLSDSNITSLFRE